jgi:hypothetical protein
VLTQKEGIIVKVEIKDSLKSPTMEELEDLFRTEQTTTLPFAQFGPTKPWKVKDEYDEYK